MDKKKFVQLAITACVAGLAPAAVQADDVNATAATVLSAGCSAARSGCSHNKTADAGCSAQSRRTADMQQQQQQTPTQYQNTVRDDFRKDLSPDAQAKYDALTSQERAAVREIANSGKKPEEALREYLSKRNPKY
jgi:hypothetical protein